LHLQAVLDAGATRSGQALEEDAVNSQRGRTKVSFYRKTDGAHVRVLTWLLDVRPSCEKVSVFVRFGDIEIKDSFANEAETTLPSARVQILSRSLDEGQAVDFELEDLAGVSLAL
jgi:hypothetical protein